MFSTSCLTEQKQKPPATPKDRPDFRNWFLIVASREIGLRARRIARVVCESAAGKTIQTPDSQGWPQHIAAQLLRFPTRIPSVEPTCNCADAHFFIHGWNDMRMIPR